MSDSFFPIMILWVSFTACTSLQHTLSEGRSELIFAEEYREQWKGTSGHWRWEGDRLIGETTQEDPLDQSSFLIWDQDVEDFMLRISFRISSQGNSGIYYRCVRGPDGHDDLLGYQADIDGQHKYTGIVYENFIGRHRQILADRGQYVHISEADSARSYRISPIGDLSKRIKKDAWNDYELIVKDALIVQKINGYVVSMVEDHAKNRIRKGLFGFQLHQGPPMIVEFENAVFLDLSL